jgi:hypothetical protein
MSNHTKEEWLVDREDYSICVMRDGEPLAVANLGAMDHNGVKYVIGDETWANAYLIRTAPQMYEMLKELMAKAYKQNWNDQYPELLERAEKVLVLATAGTPAYDDEGEL